MTTANVENFYPTSEYFFLSNFYTTPVLFECILYTSSENAYQAAKVPVELRDERWSTHATITPAQSKKLGRKLPLRPDWNEVKDDVMRKIVAEKFKNVELMKKLIETHPYDLVEGNWWGDVYWGVCKGTGKNMLGKILMELRGRLKNEQLFSE